MASVALLAEGVDRNFVVAGCLHQGDASPSSRRAWIEMQFCAFGIFAQFVALLAEGVDRNPMKMRNSKWDIESPSSRRAWIEM